MYAVVSASDSVYVYSSAWLPLYRLRHCFIFFASNEEHLGVQNPVSQNSVCIKHWVMESDEVSEGQKIGYGGRAHDLFLIESICAHLGAQNSIHACTRELRYFNSEDDPLTS